MTKNKFFLNGGELTSFELIFSNNFHLKQDYLAGKIQQDNLSTGQFSKKMINVDLSSVAFVLLSIRADDCNAEGKDKHSKVIAISLNILIFKWYDT